MDLVAFTPGTVTLTLRGETPQQLVLEVGVPGPAATVTVGSTTTLSAGSLATVTNSGSSLAAILNFGIPQGIQGIQGVQGIQGIQGATGSAATVTVGSTTTLAPGASATVTNSGTSSAAVLDFGIPSGTTIQVQAQVRNETGATLTKGTVVYINGAAGNKCTVTTAIATSDATSAQTFGIIITDIPNNQNGYACVAGLLENLDTTAFTAGTQLYLSPTTAGAMTSTKPSAPNHLVYIGVVERSHANQGTMQVRIQNGYELEELHNVAISSVANADLLAYESSTTLWKNKSISTLGLETSSHAAATYQPIGSYLTDAPSDGTTYGRKDGAWEAVTSGGGTWGSITGTLSSQSDLQDALDLKYDASNPSSFIDASALAGYATESWVSSQGYLTSVPPLAADLAMANAIAGIIYSQTTNSYGDLSFGNVPQFLVNLSTNWGIVDGSSTYYNCTGFSGSSYGLSGTVGSGPYYVRVNSTDSSFSF
jgi:hypothetical protein